MQGFFVAKLFIGMREVRSTATSHLSSDKETRGFVTVIFWGQVEKFIHIYSCNATSFDRIM
jgi:hypothetical protein